MNKSLTSLCITPVKHIEGLMDRLSSYGMTRYEPNADADQTASLSKDANLIFTNPNKMQFRIDDKIFSAASNLKYVLTASTGTNHIDLEAAKKRGIQVFALTESLDIIERISSTAEHAFALTMSILRNVPRSFRDVVENNQWNYEPYIGQQLNALTVGVIGLGRLGRKYAHYAQAFDAKVLFCDPYVEKSSNPAYEKVSIDQLMNRSDIIAVHIHLKPDTKHFLNDQLIAKAKRKPLVINTARGDIVDENAMIRALRSGVISGYATDVLSAELGGDIRSSPILQGFKEGLNIIVTPHIGGMTQQGQAIAYHGVLDKFEKTIFG